MEKETSFLPWVWGFTTSAENWNGRMAMLGFLFTLYSFLETADEPETLNICYRRKSIKC